MVPCLLILYWDWISSLRMVQLLFFIWNRIELQLESLKPGIGFTLNFKVWTLSWIAFSFCDLNFEFPIFLTFSILESTDCRLTIEFCSFRALFWTNLTLVIFSTVEFSRFKSSELRERLSSKELAVVWLKSSGICLIVRFCPTMPYGKIYWLKKLNHTIPSSTVGLWITHTFTFLNKSSARLFPSFFISLIWFKITIEICCKVRKRKQIQKTNMVTALKQNSCFRSFMKVIMVEIIGCSFHFPRHKTRNLKC